MGRRCWQGRSAALVGGEKGGDETEGGERSGVDADEDGDIYWSAGDAEGGRKDG